MDIKEKQALISVPFLQFFTSLDVVLFLILQPSYPQSNHMYPSIVEMKHSYSLRTVSPKLNFALLFKRSRLVGSSTYLATPDSGESPQIGMY